MKFKNKIITLCLSALLFFTSAIPSSASSIVAGGVISYELLMGLMGIGVSFGLSLPKGDDEYWEYMRSLKKHLQLVDDDYLDNLDKSIKEWKKNNKNKPSNEKDPLKIPYLLALASLFDNIGRDVSSPSFVASNTLLNPIYHNPTSDYQMLPNRVTLEEGDHLNFSPIISTNYGNTQIELYYKHYSGNNYQVFWRNNLDVDKWSSQIINAKPSSFALFTNAFGNLFIRVMTDSSVIRSLRSNEDVNIHIDVSKTFEKPTIEYNKTSPSVEKDELILPNLPEIAIPNKDSLPDFDKGVEPPFEVDTSFDESLDKDEDVGVNPNPNPNPNPGTGGDSDTDTDTDTDTGLKPSLVQSIINLVVPSSNYWQNTFNKFFDNVGNSFPMIDVGRFKDLCINGVAPKDIKVTIMGSTGTIFNTKYLNNVVDWLQPIVSAFMTFLLMLYNYRKVYKLIRGFEPFEGVASGSSTIEGNDISKGAMWSDGTGVTRHSIQKRYYGRDI